MKSLQFFIVIIALALPAFGQVGDVRQDTLDWHGYYPLEIGNVWELRVNDFLAGDVVVRKRIETDTLVDAQTWLIQTTYGEGTQYGQPVAEHDTLLLRYDESFGRVLALSATTGEEYDYTCDLSGAFGEEVLCGANLGHPRPIVFEGDYAERGGYHALVVGSDTVKFGAIKRDLVIAGSVPPVYYHGVGPLARPGDGFLGNIGWTYLRLGGIEYGNPKSFLSTKRSDNLAQDDIELFPNPVSNTLTVEFDNLSGVAVLRAYNLHGREVVNRSHCTSPCQIDVSALGSGTYFLEVTSKRGTLALGRFVVVR